jgi:hypothetical protein
MPEIKEEELSEGGEREFLVTRVVKQSEYCYVSARSEKEALDLARNDGNWEYSDTIDDSNYEVQENP